MSKLSIGLVTSPSEESDQLIKLLEELGIEITYHISPDEITSEHIQAENLNVWLLNVNDDDWHDNIDQLLDESEASIYFNEPGNLTKQSHPQYWCKNLVSRLYELTGIDESSSETSEQPGQDSAIPTPSPEKVNQQVASDSEPSDQQHSPLEQASQPQADSLTSALDQLESNSVGIPSDIAADLVSELEAISPELEASIKKSSAIDDSLKKFHTEIITPEGEEIEIQAVQEPAESAQDQTADAEDKSIAEEELAAMEQVNLGVEEVESELENTELLIEADELAGTELEDIDLAGDELEDSLEAEPTEQIDLLEDFDNESLDDSDLELEDFEFENDAAEIESETADISDEIMQLADSDTDGTGSSKSVQKAKFDEIDLSAEVNPILESVRERNNTSTGSVFNLDVDESDSQPHATVQEQQHVAEFLEDFENLSNDSQKDTQASTEIEVLDELQLSPKDNNELDHQSNQPLEFESELEPASELELSSELTLDSTADSEINIDLMADDDLDFSSVEEFDFSLPESESESESGLEPESSAAELSLEDQYDTGGLELESIDDEVTPKVVGKAVFIEDEPIDESAPESNNQPSGDEFEMPFDGGLELESIGDEPVATTGRAQFAIDEEIKESEKELLAAAAVEKNSNRNDSVAEQVVDTQALEIEESQQVTESLEQAMPESQLELSEPVIESGVTITDDAAELSDSLIDLDHELLDQNEPETFEIPMLDDAAMGLEFEEPSQPVMQKAELCPCWVIGASLGGPAAVKRFLQSLPKDINASFIITQHIDENFLPVLAEILTSSSQFEVKVANGSNSMSPGKIFLAPLNGKTIFLQDGSMLVDRSQKWSEPYSPCIDDVIESLSSVYKEKSGAIIFSGMGQDGLNGAKKMKALGGQVWAQSVDTCANPSMPDAVINAQLTDVVAPPEMLAEQLASHLAS